MNMKKICVLIAVSFLLFYGKSFSQVINVQTGTSLSTLNWKLEDGTIIFNNRMIGYSAFLGADYMDNRNVNLSSNIGWIRKGGRDKILYTNEYGVGAGTVDQDATLDYISANTTVDLKYPIQDKIIPFISVGPRIDFLVAHNSYFDVIKDANELKSVSFGLLLGVGVKYDLSDFQFGLRADYCMNFTKIADWSSETNRIAGQINDKTLLINLTFGYKLVKGTSAAAK